MWGALSEIDRLDGDVGNTQPIWQPAPGNEPQRMAYELAKSGKVMQLGYGGQAGGGKTDLAMGLAGTVFKRSLILRREYPQLHDVESRGDEIYPVDFVGGSKKRWKFDGREIGIASCQYEKDWKKYQGRSIGLLMFDEAAEFLENQVRSISGWLRSPEGENTLLLLCFNPPTTPEGEWIVQMFAPWIDPQYPGERAAPGEIRWFIRTADETEIEVEDGTPFEYDGRMAYPISRTFIPASRHDNPYLGEDYQRRLDNLPEPLRTMVMEGDFTVGAIDDKWQAIPTLWVLQSMERGRNTPKPVMALRAVSCDPSRGGKDETTIVKRYGNWFEIKAYPGSEMTDGPIVGDQIIAHMEMPAPIYVDSIGIGSSVYDYLKALSKVEVHAVVNSAKADEISKNEIYGFANVRAASYWSLREALDPASGENVCLPDSRKLRVDLCTPRYKVRGGKIVIEPKEDIVKRIGRSPDYGDGVVMAWDERREPEAGYFDIDGWGDFRGT